MRAQNALNHCVLRLSSLKDATRRKHRARSALSWSRFQYSLEKEAMLSSVTERYGHDSEKLVRDAGSPPAEAAGSGTDEWLSISQRLKQVSSEVTARSATDRIRRCTNSGEGADRVRMAGDRKQPARQFYCSRLGQAQLEETKTWERLSAAISYVVGLEKHGAGRPMLATPTAVPPGISLRRKSFRGGMDELRCISRCSETVAPNERRRRVTPAPAVRSLDAVKEPRGTRSPGSGWTPLCVISDILSARWPPRRCLLRSRLFLWR
jgi:hypothetical protein